MLDYILIINLNLMNTIECFITKFTDGILKNFS